MNALDLIIPVVICLMPMFAGTLKGYSPSKMARNIVDFASPAVSAVCMVIFLDNFLADTVGIINPVQASYDIFYNGSLFGLAAALWYGFFKMVIFGEQHIADRNNTGLQNDLKNGLELASIIIGPLLKTLQEKLENSTEQIMQKRNSEIQDCLNGIDDTNTDIIVKCNTVLQSIKEQNKRIGTISDGQSKANSTLEQVSRYFETIPNLYEILVSRIEAISSQQIQEEQSEDDNDYTTKDGSNKNKGGGEKKTVLTTTDGKANRAAGHQQQDEMALYLKSIGFDARSQHNAGEADILLKNPDDGKYVAIVSNKCFSLYDKPKRMQRRIPADKCRPEIILAKRLQVPMVLAVTNRENGRRWAKTILSDEIDSWMGLSTPVILAKDNDDISAQMCEEEFLNVWASLGAKV